MRITIKGRSEEITYNKLTEFIIWFNEKKTIDVDINGLKFKGKIETIMCKSTLNSSFEITEIDVIQV